MENLDLFVNFIEIRDELSRVRNIILKKETRVAIINSQSKTAKYGETTGSFNYTHDKIPNEIIEKEALIQQLAELDETIRDLEKMYSKLLGDIEELKANATKTNYLEVNIFYYRYVSRRLYTLEDIKYVLSIPYQESQIKNVSAYLNRTIFKELKKRRENRTKVVL